MFELIQTEEAKSNLSKLRDDPSKKTIFKAVVKALGYLAENPKHKSLNTHKYFSLKGPNNEEVFEAYAQNKAPSAYRVFWFYGPGKGKITILAITPHP